MLSESDPANESERENQLDQAPKEIVKRRTVLSNREKRALNEALIRFTSCGLCSLFLAAYRLNHDDSVMQTAVNNIVGGWLTLPSDLTSRGLINKCYGCRIDVEAYHFESCCPECHKLFVYLEPDTDQPNMLQIKM